MDDNGKITVRRFRIPCYDTDGARYLKPAGFLDLAQDLANESADSLGFGFDDLQRYETAWVLSRMHVEFPALPRWKDEVELRTWHKGFSGPFYVRDFRMTGADGETAVRATSSWLIIDVNTRRLLRRENLEGKLPLDTECHESAIDEPCGKIVMPAEGLEEMAEHVVAYSDVDMIGHANNARYVAWAMDCLDFEELAQLRVRSLRINFSREARPGETVELFRAPLESGWAVEGRIEDKTSFCAEFLF